MNLLYLLVLYGDLCSNLHAELLVPPVSRVVQKKL